MLNQLIFTGDVSSKIFGYTTTFADLASFLMVSKEIYKWRFLVDWDKDYVNIDYVFHLDYYEKFTKVILPSNYFCKYKYCHIQRTEPMFHETYHKLPENTKKIKFFDFGYNKKNTKNSICWDPILKDSCSYKDFNHWVVSRTNDSDYYATKNSPIYYTKLTIGVCYVRLSPKLHMLDKIEKIKLSSSFKGGIRHSRLPKNLKYLILPNHYNVPFNSETFPKGLKKLHMGWVYEYELKPGDLPEGLEFLSLNHNYNFSLKSDVLPKSITHLKLGTNYNQVIEPGVLHEGLKTLELGECYIAVFPKNTFPNSLIEIRHPERFWSKKVINLMYQHNPGDMPI